jgi:prepilin-type N-terminal cleavage/methylation domain-containing protein
MKKVLYNFKAFTLVEILIVVALFGAIVSIGVPLTQSALTGSELDTAAEISLKNLKTAQALAQAVKDDSQWGVRFSGNSVIQFKGSSYATRDQAYDAVVNLGVKTVFTGLGEVVFTKVSGMPSQTGTITITNQDRVITITVAANGAMYY